MNDVMAKALAFPLKILLTPWMFFLVLIPAWMLGGDATGDKIWENYWNGW